MEGRYEWVTPVRPDGLTITYILEVSGAFSDGLSDGFRFILTFVPGSCLGR